MMQDLEVIGEMFSRLVVSESNYTRSEEITAPTSRNVRGRFAHDRMRELFPRMAKRCRAFFDAVGYRETGPKKRKPRKRKATVGKPGRKAHVYVGERLQCITTMLASGMTQGQVARALGINQGTVSKIARKKHV